MGKRTLLFIVIGWIILTLSEYYLLSTAAVFFWILFSFLFFIILVIEIIRLFKERKSLSKLRILKVVVFACLFDFTLNRWAVNGLIEKMDWKIFYNERVDIVEQIKNKKLEPDSNGICKLPFDFPILSNGGNEISIYQNRQTSKVTVTFWVFKV